MVRRTGPWDRKNPIELGQLSLEDLGVDAQPIAQPNLRYKSVIVSIVKRVREKVGAVIMLKQ